MRSISAFIFAISFLFVSCNSNETFYKYHTIAKQQWYMDSVLVYDFTIDNVQRAYDLNLHVRHLGSYPYQNIWFFIEQTSLSDSSYVKHDTIQYFLADDFGKWYGSGVGSLKEIELSYLKQKQFPDSGMYRISVKHAMRDSILQGINDVGLSVLKVE